MSTRFTPDRRDMLTAALGVCSTAALARPWLAAAGSTLEKGPRRLVVVELFGGNDGLNTLVPFEDDRYYRARPLLGIAKNDVLALDELNGLHPSLARVRRWYDAGRVSFVQDVGYPRPNLSHFASRDVWACASTEAQYASEGWLGRGAGEQASPALLAIGNDVAPRIVRSASEAASAVPDLAAFRFTPRHAVDRRDARARLAAFDKLAEAPSSSTAETAFVIEGLRHARITSEQLAGAPRSQRPVDYPATTLARDLAAVADVIAADLPTRLFHVQWGDFDTHTRQAQRHAQLLGGVDSALEAFLADLREQGRLDDTLVLVMSEFGRRVAESGVGSDAGTDHGAASVVWLLGGGVRGGLIGAQPDLENLDADGNIAHRVDFRSVLQGVLGDWLRLDAERVLGAAWPRIELVHST